MSGILSTNTNFDDHDLWRQHTTSVLDVVPGWLHRGRLSRAFGLLKVAGPFKVLLLYHDPWFGALVAVLSRLLRRRSKIIFQEFWFDTSRTPGSSLRSAAEYIVYWCLVHSALLLIVHSSAEAQIYSRHFSLPCARFRFIPYFCYAYPSASELQPCAGAEYVLAIGRLRDFSCFIEALAGTSWKGMIIGGVQDRRDLDGRIPDSIEAHFEVSPDEYDRYLANATVVVIPLHPHRHRMSLGQIGLLSAVAMRRPVITARTFQVADYASEEEVLMYEPGHAEDLRSKIAVLMEDAPLRQRMAKRAFDGLTRCFTRDRYIRELLAACLE